MEKRADGEAEKGEVVLRVDELGQIGEGSAADGEAGDAQREGRPEGHLDPVVVAGAATSGALVLAIASVVVRFEED